MASPATAPVPTAGTDAQIARLRETMLWVADKLRRLEALPPHAWDRSSLRALYHAIEDSPGSFLKSDGARCASAATGEGEVRGGAEVSAR